MVRTTRRLKRAKNHIKSTLLLLFLLVCIVIVAYLFGRQTGSQDQQNNSRNGVPVAATPISEVERVPQSSLSADEENDLQTAADSNDIETSKTESVEPDRDELHIPINAKTITIGECEVKFVPLPKGTFVMGSSESERGRGGNEPQREVTIKYGYWLAETETTQRLWKTVMGSAANPSELQGDDLPVENVSWDDCQAFLAKIQRYAPSGMRFKLPSEEHWEYACRAGSATSYWWGDSPSAGEGNINGYDQNGKQVMKKGWGEFPFDDGYSRTAPVGSFSANAWGFKDMHGNVREWCEDALGDDASRRVIRGGGWLYDVSTCRSAYREDGKTRLRSGDLGFRLELAPMIMPERTVVIAGCELKFLWIPAGTFIMGSPETENGRDGVEAQREVTIAPGFWLAETETRQALWLAVMGSNPSEFQGAGYSLDYPVENVSWDDCQRFISRLNLGAPKGMKFSLPTEEHWEYACRASSCDAYWWGNEPNDGQGKANVYDLSAKKADRRGWTEFPFDDGYAKTAPVGSFAANAWGLKDVVGNVWEWCEDVCDEELGSPVAESSQASNAYHIIRGGSWLGNPRLCRSAYRAGIPNDKRESYLGFRLEMTDSSFQSPEP